MKRSPLQGVNLGGWLVLEKWITPSLFASTSAVDEYTFCQQAAKEDLHRLEAFRDNFITKADFVWLAEQGIRAIRLPVGYWLFGNAAPYLPTVSYVDKAFAWAKATGIKVLLDLHGAPGSQNGADHSGRKGTIGWGDAPTTAQTLEIIQKIAERYGNHPALLGISLLNEPSQSIAKAVMLEYYKQAYRLIRKTCGQKVWVVYSDSYAAAQWRKELPRDTFKGVSMDTHHYQVFSPLDKPPVWVQLLRARWLLPRSLARSARYHPLIIGEWSLALGSSHATPATMQKYAQLQLRAYQSAAAWFFWTYRTEDGGAWSFRDCQEQGLLN